MILVFVGAGGSASVDPDQYPTTAGFFQKLPKEIQNNRIFKHLIGFLDSTKKEGDEIDIEKVLWALDEIQEHLSTHERPSTLIGHMMQRGFLGSGLAGLSISNVDAGEETFRLFKNAHIRPLISAIRDQVYTLYAALPDVEKMTTWRSLLEGLVKLDPFLEIVTTNYDRVLEYAVQATIDIELGHRLAFDQNLLHWALWNEDSPKKGFLTKLHGSVNWHREQGTIIIGPSDHTSNHEQHPLLYPGYKGFPTTEPFVTFYTHLERVCANPQAAIFIGSAFRDEEITKVLSRIPKDTPKYLITKPDRLENGALQYPLPSLFSADSSIIIPEEDGFTLEAVAYLIEHLKKDFF